PVSVDTTIMNAMLDRAMERVGPEVTVLVLPTEAVAKSNEHIASPGTLTLSWETAIASWIEIGESVARAGIRKLAIVTSHGGNLDPMRVVARELRIRANMLAVCTSWRSFGLPKDLYAELDAVHGIHAGDVETSLMLHFRPDLVDMSAAKLFEPITIAMTREFKYLRPTLNHAFGWKAQDIHPDGAAGDATLATAEKGRLTADLQAAGFAVLMGEMAEFHLSRLASA
ncbi:MAG: creatininase family protein, partial [Alphaproteobacteria bacterium]